MTDNFDTVESLGWLGHQTKDWPKDRRTIMI